MGSLFEVLTEKSSDRDRDSDNGDKQSGEAGQNPQNPAADGEAGQEGPVGDSSTDSQQNMETYQTHSRILSVIIGAFDNMGEKRPITGKDIVAAAAAAELHGPWPLYTPANQLTLFSLVRMTIYIAYVIDEGGDDFGVLDFNGFLSTFEEFTEELYCRTNGES